MRACLAAAALVLLAAVMIGRASPARPEAAPHRWAADDGPKSILIETGSVESRLRAMEAQLLELRVEVESLRAEKGGAR